MKYRALLVGGGIFLAGAFVYPIRALGLATDSIIFGSFPAFSHALFFAMLWSYPFSSKSAAGMGATLVFLICAAFEVLQHPLILAAIWDFIPRPVRGYAQQGVFDILDIGASAFGALIGMLGSFFVIRKYGGRHEEYCV